MELKHFVRLLRQPVTAVRPALTHLCTATRRKEAVGETLDLARDYLAAYPGATGAAPLAETAKGKGKGDRSDRLVLSPLSSLSRFCSLCSSTRPLALHAGACSIASPVPLRAPLFAVRSRLWRLRGSCPVSVPRPPLLVQPCAFFKRNSSVFQTDYSSPHSAYEERKRGEREERERVKAKDARRERALPRCMRFSLLPPFLPQQRAQGRCAAGNTAARCRLLA